MEANPVKVIQYFDGSKQNVIPLFQRAYTWDKDNWQTLWDDVLLQYHADHNSTHFMGAIVSMPVRSVPVGVSKHLVIDGQQRLTTVALLLCALRSVLDTKRAGRIEDYLTNRHYDDSDYFKLMPTNADRESFFEVATGKPASLPSARIAQAVTFFEKLLKGDDSEGEPIDPARVLDTIERCLQVVMINLGDADDPYLIFESLNHKGEPLTQADLVRNYVLMRFRHSLESGGEQEAVYTQLWRPIEESLGNHLTEFLRHFAMKDGSEIKQGGIYASTKARFSNLEDATAIRSQLSLMRQHADAYERFVNPDREPRSQIANRLRTFNDLDVSTCYPLLLRLFELNRMSCLADSELEACLGFIESYVVRRAIVGVPPNSLSRLFVAWSKNLASTEVLSHLFSLIAGTTGRGQWPSNEQLLPAMETGSQYGRKWTRQILKRIEEGFGHKEPAAMDSCTVEHIMPQTLSDSWITALGDNYATIHQKWIHTFGNLTLSAYNPELGNQPFSEKRRRLNDSHLELNRMIAVEQTWGETQIRTRAGYLFDIAKKMWPGPECLP